MNKRDKARKGKLLKKAVNENAPQYESVHVVWRDASSIACGWTSTAQVQAEGAQDFLIHTVGWLMQDAPKYILVGLSVDTTENDACDMVLKIPRENIKSMKKLGKVRL